MNQQIALLRGINVGKAKRVAMKDLQALVTELGYSGVRTLLNSGNVVFTVPPGEKRAAGPRIREALQSQLGVSAGVIILKAAELKKVIAENPLMAVANDPSRYLVGFVSNPAELAKLAPLLLEDWEPEALAVDRRAVYLWCANGIRDSKLAPAVGKALGESVTMRNWATVLKLRNLLASAA